MENKTIEISFCAKTQGLDEAIRKVEHFVCLVERAQHLIDVLKAEKENSVMAGVVCFGADLGKNDE